MIEKCIGGELPCEDVKLEIGDVIIACEVDCRFECHGLQTGRDGVHVIEDLPEDLPGHQCTAIRKRNS